MPQQHGDSRSKSKTSTKSTKATKPIITKPTTSRITSAMTSTPKTNTNSNGKSKLLQSTDSTPTTLPDDSTMTDNDSVDISDPSSDSMEHKQDSKSSTDSRSKEIESEADSERHQCSHCNQSFRIITDLYVHLRTQHGIKPYRCPHCRESFEYKASLNKHKCSVLRKTPNTDSLPERPLKKRKLNHIQKASISGLTSMEVSCSQNVSGTPTNTAMDKSYGEYQVFCRKLVSSNLLTIDRLAAMAGSTTNEFVHWMLDSESASKRDSENVVEDMDGFMGQIRNALCGLVKREGMKDGDETREKVKQMLKGIKRMQRERKSHRTTTKNSGSAVIDLT